MEEVLELLHKLLGELQFPLLKNIFPAEKVSEQIYLKLLLQKLEKLSVDEKNLKHLQKLLEKKTVRKQLGVGKSVEPNPSLKK